MDKQTKYISESSVVLYGIPKVEYGINGCTPYPMCVRSCANYLGQDIDNNFAMVSTGAAFRLTWDTTKQWPKKQLIELENTEIMNGS